MKLPPFESKSRFYRGNLHGHSTYSDGLFTPQEVVDKYAGLGYDFTCLSDHLWTDERFAASTVFDPSCLNAKNFIILPSAELHCRGKRFDQDGLWHIVANGLPIDFSCSHAGETVSDLIRRARSTGAYVSMAHPEWYSLSSDEALLASEVDAVEIYNHSCVLSSARGGGIAIADFLLNEGNRINFIATDDSHFNFPDFGGGWVMVAARELSQNAIIAALKLGHHYASTGASFTDLSIENGILTVLTTPVNSIVLSGAGHLALAKYGENITSARFDLSKFQSKWFRITIRGSDGQMAWSNPYFKKEFKLT